MFLERIVENNHKLIDKETGDREANLSEVIKRVQNIVTHDYLVIVISDFLNYSSRVTKYLSQLAQHNDVLLIKVNDPLERNIPKAKTIIGDGNKQLSIPGDQKEIQEKFEKGFDAGMKEFESEMLRHRIPMFKINTTDPVDEQVIRAFR